MILVRAAERYRHQTARLVFHKLTGTVQKKKNSQEHPVNTRKILIISIWTITYWEQQKLY